MKKTKKNREKPRKIQAASKLIKGMSQPNFWWCMIAKK